MFVEGWNNLLSLLGGGVNGLFTVAAVIGVIVLVFALISWLWQRRKGSVSMGGFPWMAVIIGGVLAGPRVVVPVLLGIADAIVNIGTQALNWITGRFG